MLLRLDTSEVDRGEIKPRGSEEYFLPSTCMLSKHIHVVGEHPCLFHVCEELDNKGHVYRQLKPKSQSLDEAQIISSEEISRVHDVEIRPQAGCIEDNRTPLAAYAREGDRITVVRV